MDYELASGEELDRVGSLYGVARKLTLESDTSYRSRIVDKITEGNEMSYSQNKPGINMEKDYSLLLPFDLEAAKRGEKICDAVCTEIFEYAFGPNSRGEVVFLDKDDKYIVARLNGSGWRMAPLAWVEGRPVYKGDVLYWKRDPSAIFTVSEYGVVNNLLVGSTLFESGEVYSDNGGTSGVYVTSLTWQKSKTKREGWVNVYPPNNAKHNAHLGPSYPSKKDADDIAGVNRIDCVRIEWEE